MSAPSNREPGARIDPWRAVAVEQGFEGEAFSSDLPRLTDVLSAQSGTAEWPAHFRLRFGRDAEARPVASGRVELTVRLVCQRCLGEVRVPLDGPIALALIHSDAEAEGLPDHLDPVLVDAGGVRPLDLVEDELLLTFPPVPVHDQGDCEPPFLGSASEAAPKQDSPFAVLAGLQGPNAAPGRGGEG